MKQIRRNLFETNSSSVHAISISSKPYTLPTKTLKLYFGEYGWSAPYLDTVEDRLSYLYTYIFCVETSLSIKYSKKLFKWFNEDGIDYYFEDYPIYHPDGDYIYPDDGYVDHQSLDEATLERLFTNKNILYRFLFSDDSEVCIDNDNWDMEKVVNFVKNKENAFYCDSYREELE